MINQSRGDVSINISSIGRDQMGIIAAEVRNATITIGGQPTPADKEPTLDEFKQLLADIQNEIAEITAKQELLQKVDPSAPFTSQGAEQSIKTVADAIKPDMEKTEAESMQKSLTTARSLLTGILDGAKTVAQKADEVGQAVEPIAEKLAPLVEKLGVAAFWVGKLWLMS